MMMSQRTVQLFMAVLAEHTQDNRFGVETTPAIYKGSSCELLHVFMHKYNNIHSTNTKCKGWNSDCGINVTEFPSFIFF